MTFKTEGEIYDDLVIRFQDKLGFEPGRIFKAILRVTTAAIRLVYVALEFVYWNIFATYADRQSLRYMYEDWGLTWDDPTTAQARTTVLNQYRQKGVGTTGWFEDAAKLNFPDDVTEATAASNLRGLNTIDLTITYHHREIPDDIVQDIQDFFDADDKKICGIDVLVKTASMIIPTE